jgi:3-hydroxybutyryl-CoA dehydrogenase
MIDSDISRAAVIGLGTMGAGIAQMFAAVGCEVRCFDEQPEPMRSLKARVGENLRLMSEAGLVRERAIDEILGRLSVVRTERDAASGAEFVVEAVREDLGVKRDLLGRLESIVAPTTILATNTSSLNVTEMTSGLGNQDRVVVTHWFNPPHIVPVVEVVPGPRTSKATIDATVALLKRAGKTPVPLARDIPGFIVNRVQVAMVREVWALLESGIASPEDIDIAIRGSMGFRLAASGPLEITDFGGLDIWGKVFNNLAPQIESGATIPGTIQRKIDAGDFGPKTGRGIYNYRDGDLEEKRAARDKQFLSLAKLLWSKSQV